jgi:hypothetical protein
MKPLNGTDRQRSQPLSLHDRYIVAKAYYCFFCEQQKAAEELREWRSAGDAIRILLALFPELVLEPGIPQPATLDLDLTRPPATASDNVVHLR